MVRGGFFERLGMTFVNCFIIPREKLRGVDNRCFSWEVSGWGEAWAGRYECMSVVVDRMGCFFFRCVSQWQAVPESLQVPHSSEYYQVYMIRILSQGVWECVATRRMSANTCQVLVLWTVLVSIHSLR